MSIHDSSIDAGMKRSNYAKKKGSSVVGGEGTSVLRGFKSSEKADSLNGSILGALTNGDAHGDFDAQFNGKALTKSNSPRKRTTSTMGRSESSNNLKQFGKKASDKSSILDNVLIRVPTLEEHRGNMGSQEELLNFPKTMDRAQSQPIMLTSMNFSRLSPIPIQEEDEVVSNLSSSQVNL